MFEVGQNADVNAVFAYIGDSEYGILKNFTLKVEVPGLHIPGRDIFGNVAGLCQQGTEICRSDEAPSTALNGAKKAAEAASLLQVVQNSGSSRQSRVREAVKALASSDAFIDILTAELERSGAFQ